MPWIGKSVITVRAKSLSTTDSFSSLTTGTVRLREGPRVVWTGVLETLNVKSTVRWPRFVNL